MKVLKEMCLHGLKSPYLLQEKNVSYHGNDYLFVYAVFAPQKKFREFSSF